MEVEWTLRQLTVKGGHSGDPRPYHGLHDARCSGITGSTMTLSKFTLMKSGPRIAHHKRPQVQHVRY